MFIINISAMLWQSAKSFYRMPKESVAEKFLLQEKIHIEWSRKNIFFPKC
jgi:hypothetical protein